jgi:hypothetical protein
MPDETAIAEPSAPADTPVAAADTSPPPAATPEPATPAPSASDAPTPAAATPETPAATDAAVAAAIEEIVGELDGKPFKIPANVKLPWKVGDQTGFASLAELQKSPQFEGDYRRKTAALAAKERELETRVKEAEVRATARAEFLEQEFKRYQEASATGGETWEKFQRHLDMLQSDPYYREKWEAAAAHHVDQAVDAYAAEQADAEYRQTVASDIRSYITEKVAGTGIDPDRVEQLYIQALQRGAPLRTSAVDRIIQAESAYVERLSQPFKDELAKLAQRVNDLQAQHAATAHNERTAVAIDRANTAKVGAPAGGGPPAPSRLKPFDPNSESVEEYRQRWLRSA